MIEIDRILSDIDFNPIHLAAELIIVGSVFIGHWRPGPEADIAGFVSGENKWLGLFHPALTTLLAVDVERGRAPFGKAAAIVRKLHPHFVLAGWNLVRTFDVVTLNSVEVVAVLQLATFGVKTPTPGQPALGNNDTFCARLGHDHLGCHSVRLVLDVDDRAFGQTPHSAEQQLSVADDQLWATGDVGIGALSDAVI